jgi:hypothetical protein
VVEVGLGEYGLQQPGEVFLETGRGGRGVVEAEEECSDERVHFGVHVEHAVEVVCPQVQHSYQTVVDHRWREFEDAIGLLVLQQLVKAVFNHIAVLMVFQLPQ